LINSGTINVAGGDLARDPLNASQGTIDINASHHASIDLNVSDFADVTLDVQATVSLELNQAPLSLDLVQTEGGTIRFLSGSEISAGGADFNSNMIGDTTVNVSGGFTAGSTVTLNGKVGNGLIFAVSGVASLDINDPAQFHGQVDITPGFSSVDVASLADADSWSYRNDILTFRDSANHVVDRLHIVSEGGAVGGGLGLLRLAAGSVDITWGQNFHGTLT
jgi:hypothetical protein